jgi:hypothetical protein
MWLPSRIKIFFFECFTQAKSLQSVVIENASNLKGIKRMAFSETGLQFLSVPASVSRLSRIEQSAFCETGLVEIILPASIEFLVGRCFSDCRSFSSVRFESGSRLSRIGMDVFYRTDLVEIILAASVEFLDEN